MDQRVVAQPVLDQIGDRGDLEAVTFGKMLKVGKAGHRAVVAHDLANDARGLQPRKAREIHGSLGLSRAYEHAALSGDEWKNVSGSDDVLRSRAIANRRENRCGPVRRRLAMGEAVAGINRDREGGSHGGRVFTRHCGQSQRLAALAGHG